MKVCVYGAGAIGGHVAARLARGGAEVSVVARGPHLPRCRQNGLSVLRNDGRCTAARGPATTRRTLGLQDAVIVTTKAPALPSVAAGIAPLLGPETSVAFVMNGIPWWYFDRTPGAAAGCRQLDPGDAVRDAVGIPRTLGGVVYSAATVDGPGHVRWRRRTTASSWARSMAA